MKFALILGIILGLALFSYLWDIGTGLTHANNAHFHTAPEFLCGGWWKGITLPPFGIWICKAQLNDPHIRAHELVHWQQYKEFSAIGFYVNYVWGWMRGGFSYENNWMEKEAIQAAGQ